jgi:hypothetical protein
VDSSTDQDGYNFKSFEFHPTFIGSGAQPDDEEIPCLGEMLVYSHYSNNHGPPVVEYCPGYILLKLVVLGWYFGPLAYKGLSFMVRQVEGISLSGVQLEQKLRSNHNTCGAPRHCRQNVVATIFRGDFADTCTANFCWC